MDRSHGMQFQSAPNFQQPADDLAGDQGLNDQSSPRLQMLNAEPSNMFGMDQADPDASNFQSNFEAYDYVEDRLVTDRGRMPEHNLRFDDLPLQVNLNDDRKDRKSKLSAIGTLLEKAVIKDPYRPLNGEQALPVIFVNQKLYGKATEDDPANR